MLVLVDAARYEPRARHDEGCNDPCEMVMSHSGTTTNVSNTLDEMDMITNGVPFNTAPQTYDTSSERDSLAYART